MGIQLEKFLERSKTSILQKWFSLILEHYPPETRKFWETPKDSFANPIASTFTQGLEGIWNGLRQGIDPKQLSAVLDPIIHIRAIQDFSPSQAVAFVLGLKGIIREELKREGGGGVAWEDLWEMETRIDALSLIAFDQYVLCRKKVHEIELKELRDRTARIRGENRP
jgi:hypothetical protein